MEVWKEIEKYDGYSISSKGNVRNNKTGRTSKGRESGNGYKKFTFFASNSPLGTEYVHRLVADAFLCKNDGETEVNHKDGNRANNNVTNLEWVTSSGNTEHAVRTKALLPWGNARRAVVAIDVLTGQRKEFVSISKAERYFGTRHIDSVLNGKRKTAKGHTFVYKEGGDANATSAYI
jgi:hypothetical protein